MVRLRCFHPPQRVAIVDEGQVYCFACHAWLGVDEARVIAARLKGIGPVSWRDRLWRLLLPWR